MTCTTYAEIVSKAAEYGFEIKEMTGRCLPTTNYGIFRDGQRLAYATDDGGYNPEGAALECIFEAFQDAFLRK
jgi:hypothetical protein